MGLIRTTVKYGIPLGFVYWTVNAGEWKPMESSEDLKKTRLLYKEFETAKSKICPYVSPYVPEIPLNKEELIESWNRMVKKGISSMSTIDLVASMKKLMSQFENATPALPEATNSSETKS